VVIVIYNTCGHAGREGEATDKGATRNDAKRVVSAEMRNKPDMVTTPSGKAQPGAPVDADATLARFNQEIKAPNSSPWNCAMRKTCFALFI
jgi:hypothetical protein